MRHKCWLKPRDVAEGMKTISAPFKPSARAPSGKWPVVADVYADLANGGIENGIAEVARPEIELLPKAGQVRDMRLAVLAQVAAIGINHGGCIVINADAIDFVNRHNQDHIQFSRQLEEALRGRSGGDFLGEGEELRILHLAKIGTIE